MPLTTTIKHRITKTLSAKHIYLEETYLGNSKNLEDTNPKTLPKVLSKISDEPRDVNAFSNAKTQIEPPLVTKASCATTTATNTASTLTTVKCFAYSSFM